jgi:hypothetical protein
MSGWYRTLLQQLFEVTVNDTVCQVYADSPEQAKEIVLAEFYEGVSAPTVTVSSGDTTGSLKAISS